MAAGGVRGAGGVTEPVQTSTSPIGQLCQLWPCRDSEESWGAWPGVRCVGGCYLESVLVTFGKGIWV